VRRNGEEQMSYGIQNVRKQKPYRRIYVSARKEAKSIGKKTENVTPTARLREINEKVDGEPLAARRLFRGEESGGLCNSK